VGSRLQADLRRPNMGMLCRGIGGTHEIVNLLGSYIPFARTRADREARRDPRLSIQERYRDEGDYLAKLRDAVEELTKGRYLLSEDVENILKRGRLQ